MYLLCIDLHVVSLDGSVGFEKGNDYTLKKFNLKLLMIAIKMWACDCVELAYWRYFNPPSLAGAASGSNLALTDRPLGHNRPL